MTKGIIASAGIGIGKAIVLSGWDWNIYDMQNDSHDPVREIIRFKECMLLAHREIVELKKQVSSAVDEAQTFIFDAHIAILNDPLFINEVESLLERTHMSAERAVIMTIDKFVHMFTVIEDDFMKDRATDIKDVGNRLIKHLMNIEESPTQFNQPYILVAKEITPSQLANVNYTNLKGVVTSIGGLNSHAAIISRAMSIPFLQGVDFKFLKTIQQGDELIVDCENGEILVNPDSNKVEIYLQLKNQIFEKFHQLDKIVGITSETSDFRRIEMLVNIHRVADIERVNQCNADGVGLFRTEYLFMNRSNPPSEEEQFQIYKQAVEMLQGKSLVIRTLDIGGDKPLDYLSLPHEVNPSLGYRAIRVSLKHTDIFLTQLKAILRASAFGTIKIMYPMITSLSELRIANQYLELAKANLLERGIPYDQYLNVGITIEVPAAALIADLLAREVDFFSIGTNDLTQYVLAVDRMNEHVADMYDPYHPSMIRLIKFVFDSAQQAGIKVGICGEMASDLSAIPLWLGLGFKELSITINQFLVIKQRILDLNYTACCKLVEKVLACETSEQILSILKKRAKRFPKSGGSKMKLKNYSILAFVDKEFEDLEMWYPIYRLQEEGARVDIVGPESNTIYHGKYGVPIKTDFAFHEVQEKDYLGLYVPGGWAPDKLRRYDDVLHLTQQFHLAQKPIAQICHAGWVLISAKIVEGYKMTSTPGIRDDIENAGADWIDEEVVVDRNLISGRRPPDLPIFTKVFVDQLVKYASSRN